MKKIILILVLVIGLFAQNEVKFYEPSFSCSKVKQGSIEYKICTDEKLSTLDNLLSSLYKKLQNKYGHSIIKYNQLDWLKERNKCKSSECLYKIFIKRQDKLLKWDKTFNINIDKNNWFPKLINMEGYRTLFLKNNIRNYAVYDFIGKRNISRKVIIFYPQYNVDISMNYTEKRFQKLFQTDFIKIKYIKSINFSNGVTLSQLKPFAPSAKCRGFYDDGESFLLTDTDGTKHEKILLMLLDKPIVTEGNYCESGEFDKMNQRVYQIRYGVNSNIYDLKDDTFLILAHGPFAKKEDYILRFDSNLNTKSDLMGKSFFWLDMKEYKEMRKKYRKKVGYFTRKQEDEIIYEWIKTQKGKK